MNRRMRLLVLTVALGLAGTAIVATQFVRTSSTVLITIDARASGVNFIAYDGSPVDAGYVIKNSGCTVGAACADAVVAAGSYQIRVGTWAVGTKKSFTAAFAIANTEANVQLELYESAMTGSAPAIANWRMYVHTNPILNCDPDFGTPDASCVTVWNGATGVMASQWRLTRGNSYTGGPPPTGLPYGQLSTTWPCTGTFDATNGGVWVRGILAPCTAVEQNGGATAAAATHSQVWMQVSLDTTGLSLSPSITVQLKLRSW